MHYLKSCEHCRVYVKRKIYYIKSALGEQGEKVSVLVDRQYVT